MTTLQYQPKELELLEQVSEQVQELSALIHGPQAQTLIEKYELYEAILNVANLLQQTADDLEFEYGVWGEKGGF